MNDIMNLDNPALDEVVVKLDMRAEEERNREVSPPGNPMPNARRFLAAEYDHPERPLLVHQGGQFYAWNGTCWPPIEDPILRSQLYKWFEERWYSDRSKTQPAKKPFAPTMRKTADLMDALRAVTIIPTDKVTPSWVRARGPFGR